MKKCNKSLLKWRGPLWLLCAMLLSWYVFFGKNYKFIYNVGNSMEPTFYHTEWLVTQKKSSLEKDWSPDKGDVIIVNNGDEDLTKRVIATEGEHVRIKHGKIYINEKKHKDQFTHVNITFWTEPEEVRAKKPKEHWLFFNTNMDVGTVPKGYVWVIGDNRALSWMGNVKIEDIKALVIF